MPKGQKGAETAEAYGRGFRVATLFEALKQIDYPSLDLRHLYQSPVRPRPDGPSAHSC